MKDAKTPQASEERLCRCGTAGLGRDGELGHPVNCIALPDETLQGLAAIQIYSDFYGKLPYDPCSADRTDCCNYGQSWPMLCICRSAPS